MTSFGDDAAGGAEAAPKAYKWQVSNGKGRADLGGVGCDAERKQSYLTGLCERFRSSFNSYMYTYI